MIKLTEKEKQVLKAILVGDSMEYAICDPGSTITDVVTISNRTSLSLSEVKGIVGSLVKKGLVYTDNPEDNYLPHITVASEWDVTEEMAKYVDTLLEEK